MFAQLGICPAEIEHVFFDLTLHFSVKLIFLTGQVLSVDDDQKLDAWAKKRLGAGDDLIQLSKAW